MKKTKEMMTSYFNKWLLCSYLLCLSGVATAQTTTLVVLNNSDNVSVKGSLRYCLFQARTDRANRVNIEFASTVTSITLTNGSIDVFRAADKLLYIYGNGRVTLRGAGNKVNQGLRTEGDGYISIYGLQFENFSYAIYANRGTAIGDGLAANANVFINNNVAIYSLSANLFIHRNYIGTNKTLTAGLGNNSNILSFGGVCSIRDNYICSAKTGHAIQLAFTPATSISRIERNTIGGSAALGNFGTAYSGGPGGVYLLGNTISYNGEGVQTTGKSELRENIIQCNTRNPFVPSSPYQKPIVDTVFYNHNGSITIRGRTKAANDVIEIGESLTTCPTAPCQSRWRVRVVANAQAQWSSTFTPLIIGSQILVTASIPGRYDVVDGPQSEDLLPDTNGTTSEFTTCRVPACPPLSGDLVKVSDVNCFGDNDGRARINVQLGTGGIFQYRIMQTDVIPNIQAQAYKTIVLFDTIRILKKGQYQSNVRNTLTGCIYNSSVITINQPNAPLSLSNCQEVSPTSSPSTSDGRGQITISGGTPPYTITYRKDGGSIVNFGTSRGGIVPINNLAAGNYVVTVTDGNYGGNLKTACADFCNFTITPPLCRALKATVVSVTNPLCFDSVGSFRVKCVDIANNLPLILTISNSLGVVSARNIGNGGFPADSTFTISNLKEGTYNITLSSRNGACTVTTNTTLIEPTKLDILCDTVIHIARAGDATGKAEVITSGGSIPYRLSLSGAMNRPNFATVPSEFITTSIDNLIKGNYIATAIDKNGCIDTCRFTIIEPDCRGFKLTADPDSVKCFGEKNGRISLAVVNGDNNYTFRWSDQSIGNQSIANGLGVGTYRATVTDGRNCRDSVQAIISTPSVLIARTTVDSIRAAGGTGTISITAFGGTPDYDVELILNNAPRTLTRRTGNTFVFANLGKGTYTYTVTDANGCDTTGTITLNDLLCNITIDARADSVSCKNGANGRIITTVTNGATPLVYSWSNGATTSTVSGLRAATYWVAVKDSRSCVDSAYVTVHEPDSLSSTAIPTDVVRIGGTDGTIRVNIRGGIPAYSVRLANGTLATRESVNAFIFNNLPAGNYIIAITDAKGCTDRKAVEIKEPVCDLTASPQADSVRCNGGSDGRISLNINNATPPLSIRWSGGIPNDVATAENLRVGSYTASITDGRGCTITINPIVVAQPTRLTSTFTTTKITRIDSQDGTIQVVVSGGTQPYSVQLGATTAAVVNATTFRFTGLAVGRYAYTVTDDNGCTMRDSVVIEAPNCNLTLTSQRVDSVTCNGTSTGRIVLTTTGGTAPLSVNWSSASIGNTLTANNLSAGTYGTTVTDASRCSTSISVQVFEPTALNSTFTPTHITVVGQTGSIRVVVSGGTPPYASVRIGTTNAVAENATTFNFTGLAAGSYTYTVTDSKSCTHTQTVTINAPNCNLTLTSQRVDSVTCNGTATGRIVITTSGGTAPLSINWSLASIGNTLTASNLSASTYGATVTDASRCTTSISVQVFEPTALNSTFTPTHITVVGQTGSIRVVVSGGTPPYASVRIGTTNAVAENATTFNFTGLAAGTYTYIVTDAKGCTNEKTVVINAPGCNLILTSQRVDSVTCNGTSTGRIVLTTTGGAPPLSINWSLASIGNTLTANNLSAGTYGATVTDASRCSTSISVQVFEPVPLNSTATPTHITVVGQTGSIRVVVSGGTPPYASVRIGTINAVAENATTFNFTDLAAGTYTYIVTDSKGCTSDKTVVINPPNCTLMAQISIGRAISCFGAADGSINLTTNGQTPQYRWSNGSTQQNLTNVAAGIYKVTVTDANNCTQTAEITLTQPPQIRATIAGDTAICAGQSARLRFVVTNATNFSLVFSDGVNSTTTTNTQALVTPITQTTFSLVSVQSGACVGGVSGSATVQVSIVVPPTIISIQRDSLCVGSDLTITTPSSALPNVQYIWQTPNGTTTTTTTPSLTIRNANATHSGLYALRLAANTCQSAATPSLRVTVLDVPTQGVFGGDDKMVCGGTMTQLSAQAIASQHITGNWVSLDGAQIAQANVGNTAVSGLKTGNNRFVWSLTSSICGKIGTPDTVTIFVEKTPIALEKQFFLEGTAGSILINIKGLIQDSFNVKFSLTSANSNVSMTLDNRFLSFKRGDLTTAQAIEIPYQICSERCVSLCASSKMIVNVAKLTVVTDSLKVEKVFITNSSSKPSLEIDNIERFEENEVLIVDRWGARVFGPTKYINRDFPEHAWDGKKEGQPLPNGAYYYILKYKDKDQRRIERGVIYLVEGL